MQVPSTIPAPCVPPGASARDIIDFDVSVDVGPTEHAPMVHCPWHPVTCSFAAAGRVKLSCDRSAKPDAWHCGGDADIQVRRRTSASATWPQCPAPTCACHLRQRLWPQRRRSRRPKHTRDCAVSVCLLLCLVYTLLVAPADPLMFAPLQVSYQVWGDEIAATCMVRPPRSTASAAAADGRGDFLVAISPPRPSATKPWARSVVFVVDRSYSMAGEPMAAAREAVKSGIRGLDSADQFGVIAFDHEQSAFAVELVVADDAAKAAACTWVDANVWERGGTDILMPLQQALDALHGATGLPHVFLLTDGAVAHEQVCAPQGSRFNRCVGEHSPKKK